MLITTDLHLHSKYSRAVSQRMVILEIARWAKRKGINLVATADWTHPLWLRELKENLEEIGEGIYRVRREKAEASVEDVYFLLSTEIASIYTQNDRSHRIHNLVFAPNFSVVEEINNSLRSRGANLLSDGRPITDLSSINLCELVFSVSQDCLVIPAHAWTPWYSLYGSRSGFNSIKECFGQFADKIKAVETGLSSDPAMNWRISELDGRSIVSFSDAHSPQKLGREATVFEISASERLSYQMIKEAIEKEKIAYTIEFYPEEGKYHYTGHRGCNLKQSPEETKKLGMICPVCGRRLTIGVMHRLEKLASRPRGYRPKNRPPYKMLVPLIEILSEALGVGTSSQTVENEYNRLIAGLGSEFRILISAKIGEITRIAGEKVAQGIEKVRKGKLVIDPGYDGVFGKVKIWGEIEKEPKRQMSLF